MRPDGPVDAGSSSASWVPWAARSWPTGWNVRHVAETTSTNADLAAAAASADVSDRTVLVADHQTAGRGRLDRRWDAPPRENLLASILFRDVPAHPARLMQMVGVAVVRGVEALAGRSLAPQLGLKWPNDLLFDGCKLAGILAQRATGDAVVVGAGINVGWAPDGACSIRGDVGLDVDPADVLHAVLVELDAFGGVADDERFEAYKSRLLTLGAHVRVQLPAERELVGRAADLTIDGRLVVADADDRIHELDVGDVVHLRPAD